MLPRRVFEAVRSEKESVAREKTREYNMELSNDAESIRSESLNCSFPDMDSEIETKIAELSRGYGLLDLSSSYIEPTILDTSLLHIPVYSHLKMYDLKPIKRPSTPPTLRNLREQYCKPDNTERTSHLEQNRRPSRRKSLFTSIHEFPRAYKTNYQN